jgi:hypothetical protein
MSAFWYCEGSCWICLCDSSCAATEMTFLLLFVYEQVYMSIRWFGDGPFTEPMSLYGHYILVLDVQRIELYQTAYLYQCPRRYSLEKRLMDLLGLL